MPKTLPSSWGNFQSLNALASEPLRDGLFTVTIEEGRFDCLLTRKSESRLFVLLSGAHDPGRYRLPLFHRWTWQTEFPGTILCVSDPTLYLAPEQLRIGWYIGTEQHDWMDSLAELVRKVAAHLAVQSQDIICYGSSAGGFASMMLASHLRLATAVAINPQIEVFNYGKRFVDALLRLAFPGKNTTDLRLTRNNRFSVLSAYRANSNAKCVMVQNAQDTIHYKHHYQPFCEAFGINPHARTSDSGRIITMLYDGPGVHGPEPRAMVPEIVAAAVALSQRNVAGSEYHNLSLRSPSDAKPVRQPVRMRNASPVHSDDASRIKASQIHLQRSRVTNVAPETVCFHPHGAPALQCVEITRSFDWACDPFNDRNWCAHLHMWRMLDAHLLKYEATRQPHWLVRPTEVIEDYYAFHERHSLSSPYLWYDHVVGQRAMRLAYILTAWRDYTEEHPTPQSISVLHSFAQKHCEFLLDRSNHTFTNHTFADLHGLAALKACCGESYDERIEGFLDWAVPKLLEHQFTTSLVHKENSPEYHAFALARLKTMSRSGWFDRFNLPTLVKSVEQIDGFFLLPDGRRVPIGDSNGSPPKAVDNCVFVASEQSWSDSGYAVFRDDGGGRVDNASYLLMMGAFNSTTHKHDDDLSVIWFEGQDILQDAGKYAYKRGQERTFCRSRRAHNTVEVTSVSGEDTTQRDNLPQGSLVTQCRYREPFALMTGCYRHSSIQYTHKRHVIYRVKSFLVTIDHVTTPERMSIRLWSHFAPEWELQPISGETSQRSASYVGKSGGSKLIHSIISDSPHVAQLYRAASQPLNGWRSTGYATLSPSCSIVMPQRECPNG